MSLCLCFPIQRILCRHFHSSQNFIYKRFWLRHSFFFFCYSSALSLSLPNCLLNEQQILTSLNVLLRYHTTLYPLFLAFHFLLLLLLLWCCWYKNHCRPIEQTDSERMLAFPFHWSISKQHCLTHTVSVWFLLILMSPLCFCYFYCYVFKHKHYTILDIVR